VRPGPSDSVGGPFAFCDERRPLALPRRDACVMRAEALAVAARRGRLGCVRESAPRRHTDAVDRAGRHAQLAARAQREDDGVHLVVCADDRIDRAGRQALGAADADFLIDLRDQRRALDPVGGIQRERRAPEKRGESRYRPGVSPLAASTMPSETPNFILRGARLATMTVRRPLSAFGSYADLMPANTVRVSEPRSSVSLRSLSAPATACASRMRATRRSTRLNSSSETVAVLPEPLAFSAAAPGAVTAVADPPAEAAAAASLSNSASSCFGSTRVIGCR